MISVGHVRVRSWTKFCVCIRPRTTCADMSASAHLCWWPLGTSILPLPVTTGRMVLFIGKLCIGFWVCPFVHPKKWLNLLQVKTKTFHNGPSIVPLVTFWRFKCQSSRSKMWNMPNALFDHNCTSISSNLACQVPWYHTGKVKILNFKVFNITVKIELCRIP